MWGLSELWNPLLKGCREGLPFHVLVFSSQAIFEL